MRLEGTPWRDSGHDDMCEAELLAGVGYTPCGCAEREEAQMGRERNTLPRKSEELTERVRLALEVELGGKVAVTNLAVDGGQRLVPITSMRPEGPTTTEFLVQSEPARLAFEGYWFKAEYAEPEETQVDAFSQARIQRYLRRAGPYTNFPRDTDMVELLISMHRNQRAQIEQYQLRFGSLAPREDEEVREDKPARVSTGSRPIVVSID